jgi:hypothetical protein
MERTLNNFKKGFIAGVLLTSVLWGVIFAAVYFRNREKELIEYVEKQQVIEKLREDYSNRDYGEFLDNVPAIRRAADGTASGFDRKLDEILQRFRNRSAD